MSAAEKQDDNRMIVQFTAAELRSLVRDEVDRAVRVLAETKPPVPSDKWVDVIGAAKHFGCTPRTIHNWISNGAPVRRFGPKAHPMIRIDLAEFEAWVDLSKRPRTDEK